MENFWQHCLTTLQAHVDAERFGAFVQPTALEREGDVLYLIPPNAVAERFLREHAEQMILGMMRAHYGEGVALKYRRQGAAAPTAAEEAAIPPQEAPAAATARNRQQGGNLNPAQTFRNFIPGRANEIALMAAKRIADGNNGFSPLFLYGSTGLGKTHLIQAIGNAHLAKFPAHRVRYIGARSFLNEVVQASRKNTHDQFASRYAGLDMLLVDDIQYIGGDKVRTQEEFFFLFNALSESGKAVVISCDRAPAQVGDMPSRLTSRFSAGLPVHITPPEFELRVDIIRQKGAARQLHLKEEVVHFIAEQVKANVRELEGALHRVQVLAEYQGGELSVEVCRNAIADLIGGGGQKIHPDTIKQKVAAQHHLHVSELSSHRRTASVVKARHVAIYLCRQMTSLSLPDIGRHFGNRNHTSILHACRRVEEQVKTDKALDHEIKWLELSIRG